MSNYQVEPADKPQALTKEALKAVRHEQVQGISRRELLRGSLAAGMGLWLLEVTAGTIGFLWPNLEGQFGGDVEIGTLDTVKADNSALPIAEGFPAYYSSAKAFVMLVNPARHPHVKAADAQKFIDWIVSAAGQSVIAQYRIGGEQLFYPNAGSDQ